MIRHGDPRSRVERNLEAVVSGTPTAAASPDHFSATRPIIRAAVERDGELWTAIITASADEASCYVTFIRDWIVGGTRRLITAVDAGFLQAVLSAGPEQRTTLLSRELRRALAQPRGAADASPEHRHAPEGDDRAAGEDH
jgi:hypothetical protein